LLDLGLDHVNGANRMLNSAANCAASAGRALGGKRRRDDRRVR
jgi:hypothetical protein